ncbi:lipoprotein [Burkholderia pseudomallei]|nr:lipoprotein [Burkholderia pseudomallei]CAJ3815772.1 lipoprotein [Burkholderia pseudomallei]CAJ4311856.1 lipoprotein [Burkholderia pseudomallei]CAJ4329291.1 lipoprotein [Burkholderia pseudomallei]CAJ4991441.1 lipoprotein [Burkholderia pseudomallei]
MKSRLDPGFSRHALGITIAVTLAACGNKILDYRNAQIANGKVYAANADEPFSGHLTNLPEGKLLLLSPGFFKIANLIDGVQTNFKARVPAALCDIDVKAGYLDGKAVCKLPASSITRYEMTFKNGILEGEFVAYAPTQGNDRISSVTFENGLANGEQKVQNIITKNVVAVLHWQQGVKVGVQQGFDPATGNLIDESHTDEEGKADGEVIAKTPDGVVYYKVRYTHGKKDGVEETFDKATGKPISRVEWKDGKQDGSAKEWDVDGRLKKDAVYGDGALIREDAQVVADRFSQDAYRSCMEAAKLGTVIRNGKPVSPAEQQAECGLQAQAVREKELAYKNANDSGAEKPASQAACVKHWTDAYMRDPMNAGVTNSQIEQWEEFCSQGKEPS